MPMIRHRPFLFIHQIFRRKKPFHLIVFNDTNAKMMHLSATQTLPTTPRALIIPVNGSPIALPGSRLSVSEQTDIVPLVGVAEKWSGHIFVNVFLRGEIRVIVVAGPQAEVVVERMDRSVLALDHNVPPFHRQDVPHVRVLFLSGSKCIKGGNGAPQRE